MINVRHRAFKKAIRSLFLMMCLCCAYLNVLANNEALRFSENVNLALRRTAHQLLVQNGDSVTTIAPVKQLDASTFVVKMDHLFEYGSLPETLQSSLDMYGLKRKYTVAITNCESGEIQLGYNFLDLEQPGGVPCAKRAQVAGCYNLKVTFKSEEQKAAAAPTWWVLPIGSLLAGLGFIVWKRGKKVHNPVEPVDVIVDNSRKIAFGNSELDVPNLTLFSASNTYNLTYREAKLLNLFVSAKNQILERDFILKSVWEDEGIIVGRSVDVFVSRLRKMLANDPQIKISAVHGVGYRMDVIA